MPGPRRKRVAAAGPVKLVVRARDGKKRKLKASGKVAVKAKITFTPTGGEPNTDSTRLILKRR